MKKIGLLILALSMAWPAYGAQVVIFDEGTNAVKQVIPKTDGEPYRSRTDAIVYFEPTPRTGYVASLSHMNGAPIKYWKHSAGSIVEMSAGEKSAVDAAESAATLAENQARADKLEYSQEDVLTALVKVINVRIPGNPITKQELIDQLKSDKGL